MKRVSLSAKPQPSLQEILAIDQATEAKEQAKKSEKGIPKSEVLGPIKDIRNKKSEIRKGMSEILSPKSDIIKKTSEVGSKKKELRNPKSEKPAEEAKKVTPITKEIGIPISEIPVRRDKADYEKVSATLDPRMVELLEDERRRRKQLRMDYSFSEIMREALTDYFVKMGKVVDF